MVREGEGRENGPILEYIEFGICLKKTLVNTESKKNPPVE
jgi:hypothetical protein